ncbi:hypothetical protein [Spongiactinospora gelatinilytica]|uniref:hypothetical protein n=1 Tax=Spongiactinospora gelatinilytica TaxID=2666298 RepID=UPI001F1F1C8D|nr:hypothetical protein [Spongiactinospora gelatinilytica]
MIAHPALAALVAAGLATALAAGPAHAQAVRPVFGPTGFAGVKLGVSAKAAKAGGKITYKQGGAPGCSGWDLKSYPTGRDAVGLYISKKRGVAVIFAPKGVKTKEGIGLGSTYKQIKKAYPKVKRAAGGFPYVTVPGNPKAYYSFLIGKGKVYEMALGLHTQDCVN